MVNYIHNDRNLMNVNHEPWGSLRKQLMRRDRLHEMDWALACKGKLPARAVEIGREGKNKLYLARAPHQGSWTPGFWDASKKYCSLAWGGEERKPHICEILCTAGEFVPCTDSTVLLRATPAGVSEQGEPLHIGRVKHEGRYIHGKVQRSHGVCYVPIDGKECAFLEYEAFVRSSPQPEVTNLAAAFVPTEMYGTARSSDAALHDPYSAVLNRRRTPFFLRSSS